MQRIEFNWPGSVVDHVLQSLTGFVEKGSPVYFEMDHRNGYWENCEGVKTVSFTCLQPYTGEAGQQSEI